jgi:peptide/nickel transport system substrate-binding protein
VAIRFKVGSNLRGRVSGGPEGDLHMRFTSRMTVQFVAVTAMIALALGGSAFAQENGEEDEPGGSGSEKVVFTVGDSNDIDSMNPAVGLEAPAYFMYALNYDLLVNFSLKDFSPAPGIAESWETSEDGLTWTFHIREGMKWSDGEDITADDVAYTYQRTLDDPIGNWKSYLAQVDEINVVDDYTLEITTKEETPSLLSAYIYILPEHIFSEIDKQELKTFENFPNPVTSGPFHVVEWRKGQFFRMEANEDYWGGTPKIDEVVYRVFNNEDALVQALMSGDIDFADTLGADFFDSLEGEEGIGLNEAAIPSFEEIGFNSGASETQPDSDGHPALEDPQVRVAISRAIDRQTLVDRVLKGHGVVGSTIVPPAMAFYHYEPTEEELQTFDLDAANALLDEGGYADTDGDGVREMPGGGEPLEFRYFVRSEENATVTTSEFVSEWLAEIGIATEVKSLTDTKLTDVIYEGKYDMFHWGWYPDPDPDFILSVMSCGQRPPDGVWSDSFYCDEQYDQMYDEQKTLIDIEERAEVVKEMQQMVYNDAPYAVLYYDQTLQAYREDRWTGFTPQPSDGGDLLASYGPHGFVSIEPLSAESQQAAARESTGGIPAAVWAAIVAGVVLVLIGALVFRRRTSREDRA